MLQFCYNGTFFHYKKKFRKGMPFRNKHIIHYICTKWNKFVKKVQIFLFDSKIVAENPSTSVYKD